MSLSVIIPLYNKRNYVLRALDSIAAQTYTDFEIIVVDDGSTDDSGLLVEAYPDKRIRTVSQRNQGPGAARNRGLAEARGELVAFLDADDEWLPCYLEKSVRLLQQLGPEVACVTCGHLEYPGGTSTEVIWRCRGLNEGIQQLQGIGALQLHHILVYMSPCSTVARLEVIRRFGGFFADRCTFGEDQTLFLKILLNERVFFYLEPLVKFHREASGLSDAHRRIRSLEPFLSDPAEVTSVCPEPLHPVLKQFLTIRACKAAAMLGYWGKWREARSVFKRFVSPEDWRLPFFAQGLVGCSPVAGLLGRAARFLNP